MKKIEENEDTAKDKSYFVWGVLGLAVGVTAYVITGKVWFLILGSLATTFAMIFGD